MAEVKHISELNEITPGQNRILIMRGENGISRHSRGINITVSMTGTGEDEHLPLKMALADAHDIASQEKINTIYVLEGSPRH